MKPANGITCCPMCNEAVDEEASYDHAVDTHGTRTVLRHLWAAGSFGKVLVVLYALRVAAPYVLVFIAVLTTAAIVRKQLGL